MKQTLEKALGIKINGNGIHDLQVLDLRFYRELVLKGNLGLGESYVKGYWEVEDLYGFLVRSITTLMERRMSLSIWPTDLLAFFKEKISFISPLRACDNISFHYDLGNEFYELMLGKSMQYTSAYFTEPGMSLDLAQQRKLEVVAEKLQIFPGCRVLEIGCGWGKLACYLAETHGCEVTAITLSAAQYRYCLEKSMPTANGSVKFILADFRETGKYLESDQQHSFDRVVGIGTIAHFVPMFKDLVNVICCQLKGGGLALLDDVCRDLTCRPLTPSASAWVRKYIFPGGRLFSQDQITRYLRNKLIIEQWHSDRSYYRDTCLAWLDNFEQNWPVISRNSRFDEQFYRVWKYYLCGAAAGFEGGCLGQWQLVLSRMDSPYRHFIRRQR
jgi:cyclopropane-fatty-acyl-phospholipid synthase